MAKTKQVKSTQTLSSLEDLQNFRENYKQPEKPKPEKTFYELFNMSGQDTNASVLNKNKKKVQNNQKFNIYDLNIEVDEDETDKIIDFSSKEKATVLERNKRKVR